MTDQRSNEALADDVQAGGRGMTFEEAKAAYGIPVVQLTMKELTSRKVEVWDAINAYAESCGGDTSEKTSGIVRRMSAVSRVESAVDSLGRFWLEVGDHRGESPSVEDLKRELVALVDKIEPLRKIAEAARKWDRRIDWTASPRPEIGDDEWDLHDALMGVPTPCARETTEEDEHASRDGDGHGVVGTGGSSGVDEAEAEGDALRSERRVGGRAPSVPLRGGEVGPGGRRDLPETVAEPPARTSDEDVELDSPPFTPDSLKELAFRGYTRSQAKRIAIQSGQPRTSADGVTYGPDGIQCGEGACAAGACDVHGASGSSSSGPPEYPRFSAPVSKADTIRRLCDLLFRVWDAHDEYAHQPNDCFCGHNLTAKDMRFQSSGQALEWVENVVNDALRARSTQAKVQKP